MATISFQWKLAEAVENHPYLYDFHLKEYSNRDKVQRTWDAVAQEMESTVKECKETWRNMRIVFTRNIVTPPSGSKARKKPWPLLHVMMFLKSYLTAKGQELPGNLPSPPSLSEEADDSVGSDTQIEEEPVEVISESTTSSSEEGSRMRSEKQAIKPSSEESGSMGPPPKKNIIKGKKNTQPPNADEIVVDYIRSKTMVSNDCNPRRQFLLSLLPDLDEMSPSQYKIFRKEVVHLIDRITAPPLAPTYYQGNLQQSSPSRVSVHSWSGESSSTDIHPQYSEGFTPPEQQPAELLYTELAPFLYK